MKKISTKLWTQMLLLILIMIVLLWFFQITSLERFYISSRTNTIITEGKKITALIESGAPKTEMDNQMEALNLNYNARIDIYAPDGSTIYSQGGMQGMMMGMNRGSYVPEVLSKGIIVKQLSQNRMGTTIMVVGLVIGTTEKPQGVLIISSPLAPIKETVGILKQQLELVTVILIAVSLLLSYFFSRSFTKPILKISEATIKMAEGNLDVRLDIISQDELGLLSNNINQLAIELQKIEQLRKELVANVSHELRTPLSLIKGYAETIQDFTGEIPDKREKQLAIIIEESDRLKRIIDDILDFSQIQAHYALLDIKPFNLQETIRRVSKRFDYLQEQSGIQVQLKLGTHELRVLGDETRIEQVLFNLIGNAFNHTPNGGEIEIHINKEIDKAMVAVINTGEGIAEADIPFIWDRFYKGNDDMKQGIGLGLAIVQSILQAHGSQYGVESEKGQGAKFWFNMKCA